MAQNISLLGADYPNVPAVQLPKTGGGTAQFDDTTDATATAAEIASGKSAYVNNTRLVGTGQMVEPPLYIDDSINSIGIGEAPTAANNLVNTLDSSFRGQYNNFYSMPYSWSTAGVDNVQGYARIATITALGTAPNLSMPIRFEVFRTYDSKPINMYLRLAFTQDYNPSIEGLYYEENNDGIYNKNFTAFARKTGSGTYDVYVYKETASSWIGVNTYIPAYMLYRMEVSYANDLYTYVPSDAVMATQMHIENKTKYNTFNYLPYSFNAVGTAGSAGYARIATVTVGTSVTAAYTQQAIHFHGIRRTDDTPFDLYFSLFGASSDPPLHAFYANFPINGVSGTTPFEAFAYKTASNTWDIYVRKCSGSDQITIWADIPKYAQDGYTITYSQGHQASVPSGATMATPVPCLSGTPSITKTSGASDVSSSSFRRSGNVCQLSLRLVLSSAVSSGSNAFVGTVSGIPLPINYVTAVEYTGRDVYVFTLNKSGGLTVHVTGPDSAPASSAPTGTFVYLTNS